MTEALLFTSPCAQVENTEHDIEEWLKEVPVVSLRTNFDTFLQRAKTNSVRVQFGQRTQ